MWCNPPGNMTEPKTYSSLQKCQNQNIPHADRLKHSEIARYLNIGKNRYALIIFRDFSFEWKISQIQQKIKNHLSVLLEDNHVSSHPTELWQKLFGHLLSQWHHSKQQILKFRSYILWWSRSCPNLSQISKTGPARSHPNHMLKSINHYLFPLWLYWHSRHCTP